MERGRPPGLDRPRRVQPRAPQETTISAPEEVAVPEIAAHEGSSLPGWRCRGCGRTWSGAVGSTPWAAWRTHVRIHPKCSRKLRRDSDAGPT